MGQQNASIRRMMNKSTTARAYGVILATMFAILVTYVIYGIWPGLHMSLIFILFIGLWVGFFITGLWIFTREFPISSAERRRRKKEFYEGLRSQERR